MSLSTFSFKNELKAIALALALLLVSEIGVRSLESSLSLDVQHFNNIPSIVNRLTAWPGTRVLFLGNSMTREGVDVKTVETTLTEQGVDVNNLAVERAYPDSSRLLDWHYLYQKYLGRKSKLPDILVIGFAQRGLDDAPADSDQVRRIARNFAALQDVPELFSLEFTTPSQRGDYLIANAFTSFAVRERIRLRLLDALIPNFRQTQRELNESQKEQQTATVQPDNLQSAPSRATYTWLARFLKMANTRAVEVVFVAMPVRHFYEFDQRLPSVINQAGAHLIDLRSVPGLDAGKYRDALHMTPQGAQIYSRALAHELAPLLQRIP